MQRMRREVLSTKVEQWLLKRIIKKWCASRGLVGSDFESAFKAWIKNPDDVDGVRVRMIVEDFVGQP